MQHKKQIIREEDCELNPYYLLRLFQQPNGYCFINIKGIVFSII